MKCSVFVFILVSLIALAGLLYFQSAEVDCHVIHSCPSETGQYECGDLGYCQQCPDNKFCRYGRPFNYQRPDVFILSRGFGVTGSFSAFLLELKGGISDKNGLPLFSSRGSDAWIVDDVQNVRVSANLFSNIVAVNKYGKVVASGTTENIRYSLKFHSDWDQESEVDIMVGFYDAWRPESNKLYSCTKLDVQDYANDPLVRRQHYALKDIVCDRISILERFQSRGFR